MLAILYGLLSMLGYGFSNVFMKYTAEKLDVNENVFWRGIGVVVILAIILPFMGFVWNTQIVLLSLIVAMVMYIPIFAFFKGLSTGKVGIVAPIGNSAVIFTVLLSLIFFGENLSVLQGIAIVVIISGIILISINFKDLKKSDIFRLSSGVPYAMITCIGWGILFFYMKIPVDILGPILTGLIIEIGPTLVAGLKKRPRFPKKLTAYFALMIISGACGTLFYALGINLENVSIVAALTFANPVVAVVYGRFVYKEALSIKQLSAIFLIVAGVILVAI